MIWLLKILSYKLLEITMSNNLFVSNIAYRTGRSFPISSIDGPFEETISILESTGLNCYCKSDISVTDMARACVEETLSKGSFDPGDFGVLLYAANNLTLRSSDLVYPEFDRILRDFNLTNAYVHGTFMSNCANLASALQIGSALLATSELPHIVIVLSDRIENSADRFMNSAESILSDGAISFVLSREKGEFKLKDLTLRNDLEYLSKTYDIISYFKKNTDHMKEIWKVISPERKFEKVFFPNYSLLAQRGFKSQLGITSDQLYLENLSKLGHVFACDVFINFVDYLKSRNSDGRDSFAFFTIGNYRWGSFVLEP